MAYLLLFCWVFLIIIEMVTILICRTRRIRTLWTVMRSWRLYYWAGPKCSSLNSQWLWSFISQKFQSRDNINLEVLYIKTLWKPDGFMFVWDRRNHVSVALLKFQLIGYVLHMLDWVLWLFWQSLSFWRVWCMITFLKFNWRTRREKKCLGPMFYSSPTNCD